MTAASKRAPIVVDARDADVALADPALGVRPAAEPVPANLCGSAAGETFARLVRMLDGPVHASLKRVIVEALARVDEAEVTVRADRLANALIDSRRDADALDALARGIHPASLASLLGFDDAAALRASASTHAFVHALLPNADCAAVERGSGAVDDLRREITTSIARGGATSIARDFTERARDARFDDATIVANAIGFLWQGADATAGLIGNAMLALGRAPPETRARVRDDVETRRTLLSRVARTSPSIVNTRRYATRDTRLRDTAIRAGDELIVSLAASDGDAGDRAFGMRAHACPGATIAFAVASAAVRCALEAGLDAFVAGPARYLPRANARVPIFGGI